MRLSDSFRIAWTKFKARKVRTIISSLITAIMLVILISLSLAYTGNRNGIKNINGLSSDKALAYVYNVHEYSDTGYSEPEPFEEDEQQNLPTLNELNSKYPEYNVTNVYESQYVLSTGQLGNIKINDLSISGYDANPYGNFLNIGFEVRSDELLIDRIDGGQSLSIGDDGSIPVFITPSVLPIIEDKDFSGQSAKERVAAMEKLVDKYRGSIISLKQDLPNNEPVLLRVVGYAGNDSLFGFDQDRVYIPSSVFGELQIAKFELMLKSSPYEDASISENTTSETLYLPEPSPIYEFASKDDLVRFVQDKGCSSNNYSNGCIDVRIIQNALLEFDEEISVVWGFLKWVVGFFFVITTIFLFFTTSKVIGDSRRETGVFRAIGATRMDIAKIYMLYTAIITTFAYVIAFVIAICIMAVVTAKQGPELSQVATNITGSYADPVNISFVGISISHQLVIWLLAIAVGLIGGLIPIIRNVMIDPIKAMRTE